MNNTNSAKEAVETLDCGDNSCAFAIRKTGMRTNGGCRCSAHPMFPVFAEHWFSRMRELEKEKQQQEKLNLPDNGVAEERRELLPCRFCHRKLLIEFSNHNGDFVGCDVCGYDLPKNIWQRDLRSPQQVALEKQLEAESVYQGLQRDRIFALEAELTRLKSWHVIAETGLPTVLDKQYLFKTKGGRYEVKFYQGDKSQYLNYYEKWREIEPYVPEEK